MSYTANVCLPARHVMSALCCHYFCFSEVCYTATVSVHKACILCVSC